MRKSVRIVAGMVGVLAALLALGTGYLGTRVTVRGPVLHAIAGIGGGEATAQDLAGLRLPPGFTLGAYA